MEERIIWICQGKKRRRWPWEWLSDFVNSRDANTWDYYCLTPEDSIASASQEYRLWSWNKKGPVGRTIKMAIQDARDDKHKGIIIEKYDTNRWRAVYQHPADMPYTEDPKL